MGLKEYFKKRNFRKTPEPKGEQPGKKAQKSPAKKLQFVIHKHHASQLHYDLRLECDGVLKSWAVPKGPSLDPEDKHLAVQVEDHPFSYRKFEGVIPEDNYGAGEVIIWDQGTFTPRQEVDDPEAFMRRQLKSGKFAFVLHGQKLQGEFALVRLHGQKKNWLLIKKDDQFANRRKDITKEDESVKSGKTVEELAQKPDLKMYPKKSMPHHITPMLTTLVDKPFSKPGWFFEMKWDGYRAIGTRQKDKVELYSRNGLDFTAKYPEVVEALHALGHDVVLDGEIVAVDQDGYPHFEWLQNWGSNQQGSLRYYVFDLLWCDGRDVQKAPLRERKQLLATILPEDSLITYSDHVEQNGEALFHQVQQQKLEGIVAKEADSTYYTGSRTHHWLKIKTHLRQEVVIGGFTEGRGSRQYIGALLVGVYEKGEFVFVGHANAGMPNEERKKLRHKLDALERQTSPFSTEPKPNAPVHWVTPKLICEVDFSEWTKEGHMRQPEYKGMRPDKDPKEVKRERPKKNASPAAKKEKKSKSPSQSSLDLHGLKDQTQLAPLLTHLDKVFWPEKGYTKADLLNYYLTVTDTMLPYLTDRPHSLNRQPGGYKDGGFYQKDTANLHLPKFTHTKTIHAESANQDVRYLVCKNTETLLYMAQLGCIEINPWNSRVNHLTKPDWGIIDLDPEGVSFKDVVTVARTVHKVCEEWGVTHLPKTSGKTGIHIFIPMGAKYTYKQVRDFVHLLVMEVHKREPKLTSLERSPAKRHHKIYLDYLQNSEGQTLAAPYSVRPTKEATVSAPLHWDEVTSHLTPQQFTIQNMPTRLKKVGDLWKPVLQKPIAMQKVLDQVSE